MLLTSVTFKVHSKAVDSDDNDVSDDVLTEVCDKITEITERFEDEVAEIAVNYDIDLKTIVEES